MLKLKLYILAYFVKTMSSNPLCFSFFLHDVPVVSIPGIYKKREDGSYEINSSESNKTFNGVLFIKK